LPLEGCYNIITVNVGGVQKTAAGAGIPPPPEVQCAAMEQGAHAHADGIAIEAIRLCEEQAAKAKQK